MGDANGWRDWAGLPRLALQAVLSHLLPLERLLCREVCQNWAATVWEEVDTLVCLLPLNVELHAVDVAPWLKHRKNLIVRVPQKAGEEEPSPLVLPPISARLFWLEGQGPTLGMEMIYHPLTVMQGWPRVLGACAFQHVRGPPMGILSHLRHLDLTQAGFFTAWSPPFVAMSHLKALTSLAFSLQTDVARSEVPRQLAADLATGRDRGIIHIDSTIKALAALQPVLSLPLLKALKIYVGTKASDAFPRFWLNTVQVMMDGGPGQQLDKVQVSGPPRWEGVLFVDDAQYRDNSINVTAQRLGDGEVDISFGISQLLERHETVEFVLQGNEPQLRENVLRKLVLDVAHTHALRGLQTLTRLEELKIFHKVDCQSIAVWYEQGVFQPLTRLTRLELCGNLSADSEDEDHEDADGFPMPSHGSHFLFASLEGILTEQLTQLRSLCLQELDPISHPDFDAGESAQALQSLTRLPRLSSLHMSFHDSQEWEDEEGSEEDIETYAYVDASWLPQGLTSLAFMHAELVLPLSEWEPPNSQGRRASLPAAALAAIPPLFTALSHLYLQSVRFRSADPQTLQNPSLALLPPIPTLTSATLYDCSLISGEPSAHLDPSVSVNYDHAIDLLHIARSWSNLTSLNFELASRTKSGYRINVTHEETHILGPGLKHLRKLRLSAPEMLFDAFGWDMLANLRGLTSLMLQVGHILPAIDLGLSGATQLQQLHEFVLEEPPKDDSAASKYVSKWVLMEAVRELSKRMHPRTVVGTARDTLKNDMLYSSVFGWMGGNGAV